MGFLGRRGGEIFSHEYALVQRYPFGELVVHAVAICFSIDNKDSFVNLSKWV
jgi:hypothetical protein